MSRYDLLRVNGNKIPTPSVLSYTRSALDDGEGTYRDIDGDLIRSRVRDDLIKLELTWYSASLTVATVAGLLQAFDDTFFEVEYFDPHDGEHVTKEFYVGDRTGTMYSFIDGKPVFKDIRFNLVSK
ncbi:hypothetical protein GMB70_14370 [Turicibacter sanguinis]|nr:hypothetical protein [Turicibacter sanguinis]MTP79828.1 hypothetical protein [Turicibacter sanguinis]